MEPVYLTVLLVGLVSLSSAYQVQRDPCAWGPTYWCKSTANAEQCRQVHYCRQNVWKEPVKADAPLDLCDDCKEVIGLVADYLKQNGTEDEVKEALLDICGDLGSVADECKSLVGTYFPIVWNLLMSELDPDTLCAEIGLCNRSSSIFKSVLRQALSAQEESVDAGSPKDTTCDLCKVLMGLLVGELQKNDTEQAVQNAILKICDDLGSEECTSLVRQYFPDIWNALLSRFADPSTLCTEIGLCNSSTAILMSALRQALSTSNTKCDVCTEVVDAIDKVVNKSLTEEVAKDTAKMICNFLGPFGPECKILIGAFFDDIWKMLAEEMSPQEICRQLKLCGKNLTQTMFASKWNPFSGVECTACKGIMGELMKKFVNTTTAQTKIKGMVKEACNYLPNGTDQAECRTFIDSFFPTIWNLLMDDVLTPDNVCSLLGVCGTKGRVSRRYTAPFTFKRVGAKGDALCDVCKEADSFLQEFVDSANKTEIKQMLKRVCGYLQQYGSECTDVIDNYFDLAWEILSQYVDNPEEVCELLDLCNATSARVTSLKATASSGVECTICKALVDVVDDFLARNSTEAEVMSVLNKGCSLLGDYSSDCYHFVSVFGSQIYDLLVKDVAPDKMCSLIKVCTSAGLKSIKMGSAMCEVCEEALDLVKSLLPDVAGPVESALTELCSLLPSGIRDECTSFVKQYAPDLISIIAELINPEEDCHMIGLCSQMRLLKIRRTL